MAGVSSSVGVTVPGTIPRPGGAPAAACAGM